MSIAIVVILIIHLALALGAGFVLLRSFADKMHIVADWLIVAFFPFGGILVVWLLEFHQPDRLEELPDRAQEAALEADIAGSRISAIDILSETNIAPLQDMLLVADYDLRRKAILDILKTDTLTYAGHIQSALHNDDTETVHYAASGLQHIRQKLDTRQNELRCLYLSNPKDTEVATAYSDLLDQYLTHLTLDPATRHQYLSESIRILIQVVENNDLVRISRLIDHLLLTGQYQQAAQYCGKLLTEYPDSEEKYLILLKCYFMIKDKSHFDQVFALFRASDVSFSGETLNIVRLWLGAIK